MKILKIFGIVAGIHVFALILIFANPGCSSSTKPIPAPTDTMANDAAADSALSVPMTPPAETDYGSSPMVSAPITFDPNAPAVAGGTVGGGRYNPTRPHTPAASTLVAPPVADVTPATTYVVKPGDTLWELGKKYRVPYAEIAKANNIRTSSPLHAGQKLIIPGQAIAATSSNGAANTSTAPAPVAPKAAAPAAGANAVRHVVKPNETLSTIARIYGVRQGDIAVANNIADPQKIRAGTELIIPGWQATGAARSASRASSRPPVQEPASAPEPAPAPAETTQPRSIINIIDAEPSTPAPANDVPVIRVDENPMTSSPRGN